ncbi:nuclease-related domain-containing protein [Egicoccus sp. AB-alg2]|uniref:nuclease-related domain-containing protein n=1 Tax=Egicoccus sp. AB-alg2 TaxID=3242693 RepID=UPI00359D5D34
MLREEAWKAAKTNRGRIAGFLGFHGCLTALAGVGTSALGANASVVGFNVGVMVGLLPFFALLFFVATGVAHRSMGADAEEWTALELRRLQPRRWAVYHHVPLTGVGDVDHVAVGPGRVYAIESKWTARSDVERFLRGAAGQTDRQAKRLRDELASRGVAREVIPLLVVWGPGIVKRLGDRPQKRGRTRIVAGANARDWLARMEDAASRLELDWPAQQAIDAIVAEGDSDAAAELPNEHAELPPASESPSTRELLGLDSKRTYRRKNRRCSN